MRNDGSHPRRRRPHVAARARIVAGIMSIVAFVGIGSVIAARTTTGTSTLGGSASSTDPARGFGGASRSSTSIGSALPGGGTSQIPITTSHGS